MLLQDDFRKLYQKINPGWQDSVAIYKNLISGYLSKDMTILEAGCGFSNMYLELYGKVKKVIGVDIESKFLAMNPHLQEKIQADLADMPQVREASVDLIVSSWVFEHIENPAGAFREFFRVLKPRGKVIFLTPNKLNYVVFSNHLAPGFLRKWIVGKMSKDLVTDPMKTYYRANSIRKIAHLAKQSGLQPKRIILNGDPTYIAINKLFFYLGVFAELILALPLLRNFKVHIIGVLEKY